MNVERGVIARNMVMRYGMDETLASNLQDYMEELKASTVKIDFEYPVFVEKLTPVSHEKCLVRYRCAFSGKGSAVIGSRCILRVEVPVITTYPFGSTDAPVSVFGQLSSVVVDVQSENYIFPEDLVDLVDRHALAPVYSFLTDDDQRALIERIHTERKTSTAMQGEIKDDLTRNPEISWYSVRCSNFGMLHSYNTLIATEKSSRVPDTVLEEELDRELWLKYRRFLFRRGPSDFRLPSTSAIAAFLRIDQMGASLPDVAVAN